MAKKNLKRTIRRVNRKKQLGLLERSNEIFDINTKIISNSIKVSSTGLIDIDPELLKTGMLAS